MNQGIGIYGPSQRHRPAAAPTVTAADQGLSLNGTIVELGNASAASALPMITGFRHIPASNPNFGMQFNSSNVVGADNTNLFRSIGILLVRNAGATIPQVRISDGVRGTDINMQSNNLNITGTAAFPALASLSGDSSRVSINGTTANLPSLSITATGETPTNIQSNRQITLSNFAGPGFIMAGTNAAGAVFASQFSNSSVAAAAAVLSQWFVDSSLNDFEILKFSNANVGGGNAGGVDLVHTNTTVAAAAMRLRASSGSSSILLQVNGATYLSTALRIITIGDVGGTSNTTKLTIDDISQFLRYGKGAQLKMNLDIAGNSYSIGDLSAANNSTSVAAEDVISTVRLKANSEVIAQVAGGSKTLLLSVGGGQYKIGDIDGTLGGGLYFMIDDGANEFVMFKGSNKFFGFNIGAGTFQYGDLSTSANGSVALLDDANKKFILSNTTNDITILTGKGPTAGQKGWNLGQVVAGAAVLDGTQWVEVGIDGVLVKLGIIV